jgi:hypothetical protein
VITRPTRQDRNVISLVVGMAMLLIMGTCLLVLDVGRAPSAAAAYSAQNPNAPLVSPTPCGGNYTWHHVSSPNRGTDHNILRGIGVVSTNDVWAVGFTDPSQDTLIQHWNGTEWSVVPSPNIGTYSNKLYGIAVIAANDIWAVGSYYDQNIFLTRPLTLHYDGSTWTVVPVNIDFGADYVALMGVAAASPNEVIAVGSRTGSSQSTLTLHWDGTQWREEVSGRMPGCPGSSYSCSFYGVTAVGPNDAWAVGALHNNGPKTLTAHWNGTTWTRIASPNPGASTNYLGAVTNAGSNNIWAVGFYEDGSRMETLTMRWNGTAWVVVSSPNPSFNVGNGDGSARPPRESHSSPNGSGYYPPSSPHGNMLLGVAAAAPNEIWAVGSSDQFGDSETHTLILRWDGSQWAVVPSANPGGFGGYNRLYAVDVAGRDEAWASGTYWVEASNRYASLTERHDGNNCPTPTPVTPSATPTVCAGNPAWNIIPSADGPSVTNELRTVGIVSPNDIWALGRHYNGLIGGLIEHWDGNSWTIVPNAVRTSGFEDIAVISAGDIWAVGNGGGNPNGAVTAHWDGTTWTRVDIGIYAPQDSLYGIAAVASDDVWAVGYNDYGPLILHWDGTSWSWADLDLGVLQPDKPSAPDDYITRLTDVTVVGPNDIWAVGTIRIGAANRTLIMHYNGSSWDLVTSPSPGTYSNVLESVTAVSANDVWAVGYYANDYTNTPSQSLALHWNGTNWTQVTTPSPGFSSRAGGSPDNNSDYMGTFLYDVTAVSTTEVWAAGLYSPTGFSSGETVILRWNGSTWSRVTSPNPANYNALYGVAAVASNHVWAVGQRGQTNNSYTLTLRFGPPCNATPLPTNTPLSVTNTPVPPTRTPVVSTPTPAPPTFTPLPCGVLPLLQDGFEHSGVLGPNFASEVAQCQWQHGGCGWRADADYHRNGAYSAYAQAVGDVSDQRLTMVNHINVPAGATSVALNFWHIEEFTSGDGAVLETSTDGGATWQDAGPNITQGGYNGTISGPQNPLAGRQGWTDYTFGAWNQVRVNLLPYAGHSLRIRFRIGTDYSIGTRGWNIDDVTIVSGGVCATGTVTPPPGTTTPAGTPPTSTQAPSFTPVATPTCGPMWQYVQNPGTGELHGIGVVSPNNVWAVGNIGGTATLIMRWNGASWSVVPGPDTGYSGLEAISVVSANDIWAVGYANISGFYQPMSLHWDGALWTEVTTPRPTPGSHGYLRGVGAVSSNDVWAVGDGPNGPLTMHWDGTQWTVVPSMDTGNTYVPGNDGAPGSYYNTLLAVGVVGPNDVWAVGTRNNITWALHWDGTQWSQVSTPNPGTDNTLNAITVIATNDIWAVGHIGFYQSPRGAIALHWDGTRWTSVPPPAGDFGLFGVTATASNHVWAVGWEYTGQWSSDALILGWNGSQWSRVSSPNPSFSNRDELFAADAAGTNDVWAVGRFDQGSLTDRYYGAPCHTPAPTNTPGPPTNTVQVATGTPALPTATATVPLPTTVPTAIACNLGFSDVPTTNTFYHQVMCLSCMGFVGGYPDGTFRPDDAVTRGQLAKIVSNAAGFSDTPTQQTFEDVPVDSTFYMYAERVVSRGVISGYRCGGEGEPCGVGGEGNRPYFRPGANATRGQISKIVSNAAGLQDVVTSQTFEDVPPSHTFYTWIERLAMHGMMGGYSCAGTREPCSTANRPYFRPASNATRGQVSKIVGNGFYPDCTMR